jgi:hypothetical protein
MFDPNPIAKTLYFYGAAIYHLFMQAYTDRYLSAYSNEKYCSYEVHS